MQAVVLQQHGGGCLRRAGVAHELGGIAQCRAQRAARHAVDGAIGVAALGQRRHIVQHLAGEGDDLSAALLVIAGPALARDRIRPVQRVVQAAPPGIGGVQRETRVRCRHHQLRPGDAGDLVIDEGGVDGKILALGQKIADLSQEAGVGLGVHRAGGEGAVPGVNLGLERITHRQQGGIARAEIGEDGGILRPEVIGADAGAGQRLVGHEGREFIGHLQTTDLDHARHHPFCLLRRELPVISATWKGALARRRRMARAHHQPGACAPPAPGACAPPLSGACAPPRQA